MMIKGVRLIRTAVHRVQSALSGQQSTSLRKIYRSIVPNVTQARSVITEQNPFLQSSLHSDLATLAQQSEIEVLKSDYYWALYEKYLRHVRAEPINLLEIGVHEGGSLLTLARYLPQARLLGIDLRLPSQIFFDTLRANELAQRVRVETGVQDNIKFIEQALNEWFGSQLLDVVIDDASHLYKPTKTAFEYIFYQRLKTGGIYIIEDWGAGYWTKWADGHPNGKQGLPKLIKELIDDVALLDRTMEYNGRRSLPVDMEIRSQIQTMIIQQSVVVIVKA